MAKEQPKQKGPLNSFEPSGTVDGSYTFYNAPWPSTWRIFLMINFALTYVGEKVAYQFSLADDPANVEDQSIYPAYFDVPDFTTSGTFSKTNEIGSTFFYNLNPNTSNYFDCVFNAWRTHLITISHFINYLPITDLFLLITESRVKEIPFY